MIDYKNHTDETLMSFIQKGDEGAFNEIYARYSQRLLHFLFRMLGQDEAKAQDFLQDIFVKIVSAPEKFNTEKVFKTWVFTVAANLCKNSYRTKQHLSIDTTDTSKVDDFGRSSMTNALDEQLFKKELLNALERLTPVYKEVFILRYHQGLSLNEIASVANCPLGTVKSRLHSATRLLSEQLIHHQPD